MLSTKNSCKWHLNDFLSDLLTSKALIMCIIYESDNFSFFHNINYCIFFLTLWAKIAQTYSWWQLDINFAPYDLPKKHFKQNYHVGEVCHPGSWTNWSPNLMSMLKRSPILLKNNSNIRLFSLWSPKLNPVAMYIYIEKCWVQNVTCGLVIEFTHYCKITLPIYQFPWQ